MGEYGLAAFKVERRAVATAVFVGSRLDYTQVRQLSSLAGKAEPSAVAFVNWLIACFHFNAAALEQNPQNSELRRAQLGRAVEQVLRAQGIPFWAVDKQVLFGAFGIPPVRSRKELREVVSTIWPILASRGNHWVQDAVALGLYEVIERLFTLNDTPR